MKTLLIVDDISQNLYILEILLKTNGYAVQQAANGMQALEIARRQPPDMIISDILMPIMDGFSLCRAWKNDELLKNIPFVFYTATYTDPKDRQFALSLGADRFLVKPLEPDEILQSIQEMFDPPTSPSPANLPIETGVEENHFYEEYNQVLIRKLEDKMNELRQSHQRLLSLYHTSNLLGEMKDEQDAVRQVLAALVKNAQYARAHYFSVECGCPGRVFCAAASGYAEADLPQVLQTLTELVNQPGNPLGQTILQARMLNLADASRRAQWTAAGDEAQSVLIAPVRHADRLFGALALSSAEPSAFSEEDEQIIAILANNLAISIENTEIHNGLIQSNQELTLAYDATIQGWSLALDLRDKETEGHTLRVTELAVAFARRLGIAESELQNIRRGALLHDIGKIGVPDSILNKPGPLNDEEWVIMRRHPETAYQLLSTIDYLKSAIDIPYYHHERWDGNGYPRGLRGEQIPLAARFFSIIDVWDALSSDRPYRSAWPQARVLEYIHHNSGAHFDPALVPVFLDLVLETNAAENL